MLIAACGHGPARGGGRSDSAAAVAAGNLRLPHGVMSPIQACERIVFREPRGFFSRAERVHLVLTTYAEGEPVQSRGDISTGVPPSTLVWIVEVHARAVHWDHSVPAGAEMVSDRDYSVVMNARTGRITAAGECNCWPLPLQTVGRLVSLPARC